MKFRLTFVLLFLFAFSSVQSQEGARVWGDGSAAQQYANWAKQMIDEGRWSEALAGLERAADFANVSSDISYLLALARSNGNKSRSSIIESLDFALEINRWVIYDENQAFLFKAAQLVAMRKFYDAIVCLDKIGQAVLSGNMELSADAAMTRLLAFRGIAADLGGDSSIDPAQALIRFRSLIQQSMDRFPRDPRPLRIFFGYIYDRVSKQAQLSEHDQELLDLALRRLPFILEADPEIAWMAALFTHDTGEALRLVSAYRAGGYNTVHTRDFYPSAGSIPAALKLGLLGDTEAVNELFSGNRGINSMLPQGFAGNKEPVLEKDAVTDVYNSLGSEEGRNLFTLKLLSFSGFIISNDDHDGYIDGRAYYQNGVVREIAFDRHHNNVFDLRISFSADGVPVSAEVPITGMTSPAYLQWERYPSVRQASLADERFAFRPVEFQFAPISFITLGGSTNLSGLAFPVLLSQYLEITRRTFVSYSSSILRPSFEFDRAIEQIFLDRGIPLQAIEVLNGKQISITEFEKGAPVLQYVDLDLDGRLETVRRFHAPGHDFIWPDIDQKYDYRKLIASSESDWMGEGQFKTGEVYQKDGSVIYNWDMDGSGIMTYSETENGNR